MSRFVEECQKEWNRLGVPQAAANEMAADLEADLAEAQADGVSPEEVLGNGYFDAKSFAAAWATARGMAGTPARTVAWPFRSRSVALAVTSLACLAVGALGLLILFGGRVGSASVAVAALRHSVVRPGPGIFIGPQRFSFGGAGAPVALVGVILIVAALVGVGITLWLWKPWRPADPSPEGQVGMPTYL
jgi:hypothetical protein